MVEALLERGLIPDWLIRRGIRQRLRQRLVLEGAEDAARAAARQRDVRARLREGPVTVRADAANAQHYEVPAAFFAQVLGPHMKYSSALWPDGVETLAEAERQMLEVTCERADVRDGMRVLDLGCGWGSLALHVAARHPTCRVTALSNSASQRAFIERRCRERGIENVEVVTADVATYDTADRFDRIVSVEMLEHVRDHETLFRRIRRWLAPEGRLFVHVFVHRDLTYLFEEEGEEASWMGRRFFTGGLMPSEDLLPSYEEDLVLEASWRVNGTHYARTARAWLDRLDGDPGRAARALRPSEGSEAAARRAVRAWRVFFMACEELWGFSGGDTWFVAHYRFRPRGTRVPA